jgi:chromosome segregation ATPase
MRAKLELKQLKAQLVSAQQAVSATSLREEELAEKLQHAQAALAASRAVLSEQATMIDTTKSSITAAVKAKQVAEQKLAWAAVKAAVSAGVARSKSKEQAEAQAATAAALAQAESTRLAAAMAELQAAQAANASADRMASLEAELKAAQSARTRAQDRCDVLQAQLRDATEAATASEAALADAVRSATANGQRVEDLSGLVQHLRAELAALDGVRVAHDTAMAQATGEVARLTAALEQARSETDVARADGAAHASSLAAKLRDAEAALRQSASDAAALKEHGNQMQSSLHGVKLLLMAKTETAQRQVAHLQAELASAKAAAEASQAQLLALQDKVRRSQERAAVRRKMPVEQDAPCAESEVTQAPSTGLYGATKHMATAGLRFLVGAGVVLTASMGGKGNQAR